MLGIIMKFDILVRPTPQISSIMYRHMKHTIKKKRTNK